MATKLHAGKFYAEYHGHRVEHLTRLRELLASTGPAGFIYLAGDSSLDNKHWFFNGFRDKADQVQQVSSFVGEAVNGYEKALAPPLMVKDVAYWINKKCAERANGGQRYCCINTSIEESTIVHLVDVCLNFW